MYQTFDFGIDSTVDMIVEKNEMGTFHYMNGNTIGKYPRIENVVNVKEGIN